MKIAFLVGHFPVISEAFILTQIAGLLEQGHEVDIYALDGYQPVPDVHPIVVKHSLLSRTHYSQLIPSNFLSRVIEAIRTIRRQPQISLNAFQLLNVFKYGRLAASLRLFLKSSPFLSGANYDIIHCQFGTYGFLGQILRDVGLLQGKLVTTFRGYDISSFVQENGDKVYDNLFKKGDYFLVNCDFFAKRLLSLGCPSEWTQIHFSGINCSNFIFSPRHFPEDGIVRLVTTGRLVEKKGIEYCLQAIAEVVKTFPDLEYTIIGDGPLRTSLEQLVHDYQLEKVVKFLGWKRQDEIADILSRSHIFMAPSITASDGNQDAPVNTLKEAMAVGLPVISTFHGGIPELVEDRVSGFLVPERDAGAIAEKLQYLLQNSHLWPAIGLAGRKSVEEKFDCFKLNNQLISIYEYLLSSPLQRNQTDV